MWAYVFLFAFVTNKVETELTGVEDYLLQAVRTGDMSILPLHRALALQDAERPDATEGMGEEDAAT